MAESDLGDSGFCCLVFFFTTSGFFSGDFWEGGSFGALLAAGAVGLGAGFGAGFPALGGVLFEEVAVRTGAFAGAF